MTSIISSPRNLDFWERCNTTLHLVNRDGVERQLKCFESEIQAGAKHS